MYAIRAFALASSEATFMAQPPRRPQRSQRRSQRGDSGFGSLLRSVRRSLADAAAESTSYFPHITLNYPY